MASRRRFSGVVLLGWLGWVVVGTPWIPAAAPGGREGTTVPVLYCTDLFHPHDDPDDHFDLATVYALPGLDVRGIVLDQGRKQSERPGRIPVEQLNALTGRRVPVATGLGAPLKSTTDTGAEQPESEQGGVRLILDTLRAAAPGQRVHLIAVGSLRDVTAAFNRAPDLFREHAGRLLVFVGEASQSGFREYNVDLDPRAFVGLFRSGLDVYWVPCFDGGLWRNDGHASFWQARQGELLRAAPPELVQFFVYALEKETAPPVEFLHRPVDPARRDALFRQQRNLWCTVIFATLAAEGPPQESPFAFETVDVTVDDDAVVRYGPAPGARRLRRFRVLDSGHYAEAMTRATADVLGRFPLSRTGPSR